MDDDPAETVFGWTLKKVLDEGETGSSMKREIVKESILDFYQIVFQQRNNQSTRAQVQFIPFTPLINDRESP